MGLFDRISTLFKANINDLISSAEIGRAHV